MTHTGHFFPSISMTALAILLVSVAVGYAQQARGPRESRLTTEQTGGSITRIFDFANKLAVAQKIVALNPVEQAVRRSTHPALQHQLMQQLLPQIDWPVINDEAARLMAEMFTQEELDLLYEFNRSRTGQSVNEKLRTYQIYINAIVQEALEDGTETLIRRGAMPPGIGVNPNYSNPALGTGGGFGGFGR